MDPSSQAPQISILDARLAEIDQRLRSIQSGLGPAEAPSPVSPEPAATPPPPLRVPGEAEATPPEASEPASSDLLDRVRELTRAQERVLASLHDLLAMIERVALTPPPAVGPTGPVTVSAGPFADLAALRDFERRLGALPGVRRVEVRGFEGQDRAVIDVHLSGPTA